MHHQSVAEHVPHDDQVGLLTVHAHAVHPQELWQQGATVTLHNVLRGGGGGGENSECGWLAQKVGQCSLVRNVKNKTVFQSPRVTFGKGQTLTWNLNQST